MRRSTSSAPRVSVARRRVDDSRCAGSLAGDFTIVLFHRFAAGLAAPNELVPVIMGSYICSRFLPVGSCLWSF
jgi:hypothetical protein